MTVIRGFSITIVSGLVGGGLGALVGYALGRFAPDYYRVVFQVPASSEFDAVQIGIGLGVTQGLTAGLIVGLVVVVSVAWSRSQAAMTSVGMPKAATSR